MGQGICVLEKVLFLLEGEFFIYLCFVYGAGD
jgi:hypothetical protein